MKDTREKLLKTAAQLFARDGYAATSVRDIVRRAGVNIAAVHYHFGDKRGLYLAAFRYLSGECDKLLFSPRHGIRIPQDVDLLSREEALELLHKLLCRMLDLDSERKNALISRFFMFAELDPSGKLPQILMQSVSSIDNTLCRLLARAAGVKHRSAELAMLANVVFGQIILTDFKRSILLRATRCKEYNPRLHAQVKKLVWHNTYAILKSYDKGIKKS